MSTPPEGSVVLHSPVRRPEPKVWRIYIKPLDSFGYCDFADRKIELAEQLEPRQLTDTALHEAAHAAAPDLAEAAIVRIVKCQMALLTYLGLVAPEDSEDKEGPSGSSPQAP